MRTKVAADLLSPLRSCQCSSARRSRLGRCPLPVTGIRMAWAATITSTATTMTATKFQRSSRCPTVPEIVGQGGLRDFGAWLQDGRAALFFHQGTSSGPSHAQQGFAPVSFKVLTDADPKGGFGVSGAGFRAENSQVGSGPQ
jgi:hypothetical protein